MGEHSSKLTSYSLGLPATEFELISPPMLGGHQTLSVESLSFLGTVYIKGYCPLKSQHREK